LASVAPFLPFLTKVQGLSSGGFGAAAAGDPEVLLAAMNPAGPLEVNYPPKGKVIGITTDRATVDVVGSAADWLPHLVKVQAQADNGPVISTALDLHTLHTDAGGGFGRAAFSMRVPVPHGGLNTLKVWTTNAAGAQTKVEVPIYMDGTQFPQEGSVARPVSSFNWQAESGGFLGFGASVTARGVGRVTFLDAQPGQAPVAGPFSAAGDSRFVVTYPDGSTNPDFDAYLAGTQTQLTENGEGRYSVPGGAGDIELRLKSRYRGKAFLNVVGNADATELQQFKLEYPLGCIRGSYPPRPADHG
jgi:hypothetical protein